MHVREHALITASKGHKASLDLGIVTESTFRWLCDMKYGWQKSGDVETLALKSRNTLKLGSYVGYLESPSGEGLELLPKTHLHQPGEADLQHGRKLLCRMLLSALRLDSREAESAELRSMNQPLHEWIFGEYLRSLSGLIRRGLRFDYQRVEEESRFIRGQLDQGRQARQTPERATRFHVRHDVFTANRIENRLLRTATDIVLGATRSADNWRLANELCHQMAPISPVSDPVAKLAKWGSGKLMRPYAAVRPWCELILRRLNPNFQKGESRGIALIFPMEKLFESYVGRSLSRLVTKGYEFKQQAQSETLLRHQPASQHEQNWFRLKPDYLIKNRYSTSVLDGKWKLLDARLANGRDKYNLSQSDLYQMFAYGQKYQSGSGNLMLIFPSHPDFREPLPPFSYSKALTLWVVPFDCDAGCLVGSSWKSAFSGFLGSETVALRRVG